MNWHWQKRGEWKGWTFMATYGQNFCIGIGTGYGWTGMRINGCWISLGPLTIDVQPPCPKWLTLIDAEKEPPWIPTPPRRSAAK